MKKSVFKGSITNRIFPVKKNEILVRFENLADRFDRAVSPQ